MTYSPSFEEHRRNLFLNEISVLHKAKKSLNVVQRERIHEWIDSVIREKLGIKKERGLSPPPEDGF